MDTLKKTKDTAWIYEIKNDFEEFFLDLSRWYRIDERCCEEKDMLFKEKLAEGLCELVDGYADIEGEMSNGKEWTWIRIHGNSEGKPSIKFFTDLIPTEGDLKASLRPMVIIENEETGESKEFVLE